MSEDYTDIKQLLAVPLYAPRPKPTPIPAAAWNDAPLFCLGVNDEWVSHILGVLTALDQPDTWLGTEEEIFAARQQVNQIMAALMERCVPVQYPQQVTMWHDEATVIFGGSLATYHDATQHYGVIAYMNAPTVGDRFRQQIFLEAGTYEFGVLGWKQTSYGKISWQFDDQYIAENQDWYAAASVVNHYYKNDVTVIASGLHTLRGTIVGKNAASSNYYIGLTKYWFRKRI